MARHKEEASEAIWEAEEALKKEMTRNRVRTEGVSADILQQLCDQQTRQTEKNNTKTAAAAYPPIWEAQMQTENTGGLVVHTLQGDTNQEGQGNSLWRRAARTNFPETTLS